MAVLAVCVWFEINTSAPPITGRSYLRDFNLIFDCLSVTFGAFSCSFLNWCSSMILVSEPVSGSTCVSFPLSFPFADFVLAFVMCFQVLHLVFIITIHLIPKWRPINYSFV